MKKLFAGIVVLAASLLPAASASAIVNGQPDGNRHPEVGALLAQTAFPDGTWAECSGTLISPTVFLTAAHCDEGVSHVNITLDSSYVFPTGVTLPGTWHADPAFRKGQGDPHDIAVVVLDNPVSGITPARLPAANSLSGLAKDQKFTPVGYGAQAVSSGGQGGKHFSYADVRFFATGTLNAVTRSFLRISQNASTGNGGTCYGDSGGPNFRGTGNVIAGITITGDTPCRSTNVDYRLDTKSARSFLSNYVTVP